MSKRSRTESAAPKKEHKPKKADVKMPSHSYKSSVPQFGKENKRVFTCANARQMVDTTNGTEDTGGLGPALEAATYDMTVGTNINRTYLSAGIPTTGASNGRTGKKIWLDALQIRGVVKPYYLKTTEPKKTSLFLIYVKKPNAATVMPTPADILETANSLGLSNLNNATDFRVLRRWDFMVGAGVGASTVSADSRVENCHIVDEYISLKKLEVVWKTSDSTGAWANLEEGGLFLMFLGDQTNASNKFNVFQFSARLYYYSG